MAAEGRDRLAERPDIIGDGRRRGGGASRRAGRRFAVIPKVPGVVGALFFLTGVWLFYVNVVHERGGPGEGPSDYYSETEVHEEYGRKLTDGESAQVVRFGEPLFLGRTGRPAVEVYGTGVIREVTDFERAFPDDKLWAEGKDEGTMVATGPRGLGVVWGSRGVIDQVEGSRLIDRAGWFREQGLLVREGVNNTFALADMAASLDPMYWDRGLAVAVEKEAERLNWEYGGGVWGAWYVSTSRWICDEELDVALRMGSSLGCPDPVWNTELSNVWARASQVARKSYHLAKTDQLGKFLKRDFVADEELAEVRLGILEDLKKELVELRGAVLRVELLNSERGGEFLMVLY